ncbi:histone-lysine N-methyltransferase PR-Set7-like [Mercenaria mercenaria]|uniref:histone-lysine N-methyltransferase PR-Set7-like n=1 Tax=Mercenaria mercenaria TaxID=6596 RepID=UPI00234EC7E4|nr:histone-lysine N-methyltransferase PR-Set7-like [Mercenaria mercenaria]
MFFFNFDGKPLCIDGTYSGGVGRMINDEHRHPNCKVKVSRTENGNPQLAVIAIADIDPGHEIRYDYGDRSVSWRKNFFMSDPTLFVCQEMEQNLLDWKDLEDLLEVFGLGSKSSTSNSQCTQELAEAGTTNGSDY